MLPVHKKHYDSSSSAYEDYSRGCFSAGGCGCWVVDARCRAKGAGWWVVPAGLWVLDGRSCIVGGAWWVVDSPDSPDSSSYKVG